MPIHLFHPRFSSSLFLLPPLHSIPSLPSPNPHLPISLPPSRINSGSGGAYNAAPEGPGGAWPPNDFWCIPTLKRKEFLLRDAMLAQYMLWPCVWFACCRTCRMHILTVTRRVARSLGDSWTSCPLAYCSILFYTSYILLQIGAEFLVCLWGRK